MIEAMYTTPLKKTKIVATIGPVTESQEILEQLSLAGLDFARLNMSHGDIKEHQKKINTIRAVVAKTGKRIGIIQDLAGPKIRTGDFYQERVVVAEGDAFTFTTKKCLGDEKRAYINYDKLPKEVKRGSIIMLDDGKKKFEVLRVVGNEIVCRTVVGGELKGRRGVNVPGAHLSISSLTEKDKKDLMLGIKNKVDYVALSFVRTVKDVEDLRKILVKAKAKCGIIAKIETEEAVVDIDDIIEACDAIMVARGDLAVEIGPEKVPAVQKMIIKKCNDKGKPVITATQMLESMIHSPTPTRAEVSDVANSILDGTDAVMLSEETTLGHYPLKAVETMVSVALQTEKSVKHDFHSGHKNTVVDSVSLAVASVAEKVSAKAIFALSESGFTARMISRHKPAQPIMVLSPHENICNVSLLSFGCYPTLVKPFKNIQDTFPAVKKIALEQGLAKTGDKVVVAGGMPFGHIGGTNMMIIVTID